MLAKGGIFSPLAVLNRGQAPVDGRWSVPLPENPVHHTNKTDKSHNTASNQGVHPLNLSISVSGGKEINRDSLSSCERKGISPRPNPSSSRNRKNAVVGQGAVVEGMDR